MNNCVNNSHTNAGKNRYCNNNISIFIDNDGDISYEFYNALKEKFEKYFDNAKIDLNDRKLELFLNGVQLTHDLEDGLYRIYNNNNFIGLGIVKNKLLKRDIVI